MEDEQSDEENGQNEPVTPKSSKANKVPPKTPKSSTVHKKPAARNSKQEHGPHAKRTGASKTTRGASNKPATKASKPSKPGKSGRSAKPSKSKTVDGKSKKPAAKKTEKSAADDKRARASEVESNKRKRDATESENDARAAEAVIEYKSIVDDFPENELIGQFTRATRFSKMAKENGAWRGADKVIDISLIPGIADKVIPMAEAPDGAFLTEEKEAEIVRTVPSDSLRFSRKSIQYQRIRGQEILEQTFCKLGVLCDLQKKQTLCMETLNADALLRFYSSPEIDALAKEMLGNDYHQTIADNYIESYDKSAVGGSAYKSRLGKFAVQFHLDKEKMLATNPVLYNNPTSNV